MKKIILAICMLCFLTSIPVCASEIPNETEDKLFSLLDFSDMEDFISDIFPDEKMGCREMVKGLISGEI